MSISQSGFLDYEREVFSYVVREYTCNVRG